MFTKKVINICFLKLTIRIKLIDYKIKRLKLFFFARGLGQKYKNDMLAQHMLHYNLMHTTISSGCIC